jgi:hypothetical protein
MGNQCNAGVDESQNEIVSGIGIYNYKKSVSIIYLKLQRACFSDKKEVKFHEKTDDYDNVKDQIISRSKSQSFKRVQKQYKNGQVNVVLF